MIVKTATGDVTVLTAANYRNVAGALFGVLNQLESIHNALLEKLGRDNMLVLQARLAHNAVATFENTLCTVMSAEPFDIPEIGTPSLEVVE